MSTATTPRGPGKQAAMRNVRAFLANRVDFLQRTWESYGDHARFQLGVFDVYLINDPALIRHVLMNHTDFVKTPAMKFLSRIVGNGILLSDGAFHKRQRSMMQPAFTPKRISTYCEIMTDTIQSAIQQWDGRDEIDIHDEMMKLALNIATRTLFGTDVSGAADRVSSAMNVLIPMAQNIARPTGVLRMLLPTKANRQFSAAIRDLNDIIYDIIAEHRERGTDQGDLLSRMLAAQDEDGGGAMTDEQLRDETMTLLLAGHETTAVALSWAFYAISQHPAVADRIRNEVRIVLEGRVPTIDDIPNLRYTRMVVAETLRLYPPIFFFDRITTKPWNTGHYVIGKNKYIFLSPFLMQRHPDYWPDPERFDPERFDPGMEVSRPKFSYFPFGGGARICIGEMFAWTEMILTIATITQNYTMTLCDGQNVTIDPLITLRPTTIRMKLAAAAEPIPKVPLR